MLEDNRDDEPFLTEEPSTEPPQPTRRQRLWRSMQTLLIKPTIAAAKYAFHHPISTTIAVATALPGAIYSFLAATDSHIQDVSSEWWNNLATNKKIHALISGTSTLAVYGAVGALFVANAFIQFKDSIKQCFKGLKNFLGTTGQIIFGISSGLSAAALAYAAFLWLPVGGVMALIPATFNFVVNFAIRFVSAKTLANKFLRLFNKDERLKQECISALHRIKQQYIDHMNAFLAGKPINENTLHELFIELSSLSEPIRNKTHRDYAKEYAAVVFDITFSLAFLAPTFMMYTQKGADGVKIVSDLTGSAWANTTTPAQKFALGSMPGLASSLFIMVSTLDFRGLAYEMAKNIYYYPSQLVQLAIGLTANVFASEGMISVVKAIENDTTNIFALSNTTATLLNKFMEYMNVAGTFIICNAVMFRTALAGRESPNPSATDLDKLIHFIEKNPFSVETAGNLRKLGLFSHQPDLELTTRPFAESTPTNLPIELLSSHNPR